ncbi:MAG: acetylornithine aminotransferase [Sulfuricurvum sp. PC08-66]|nr:MAG: acetylornithine aminotransferase [Sulfuricurvum sp. PC08-66]
MNLQTIDQTYVMPTYKRNYTNFVKGDNATLWDDAQQHYIDFTSGIGVCSVGHANARVATAIAQQAQKILHISNLYVIEPQAKLAQAINALYDQKVKCFFANSGAEANEGAIKIARKYGEKDGVPKRYKIITLDHSFHGRTISALKATGQPDMHTYFGPFPDGFVYAKDIDAIESLIDEHTVAVMIELVQGEGGVEAQDKAKVQALAKLCKARNVLLIVDEVQTGVYRTGEFTASQTYGIKPDVITLAKGLGGGVPIGAILTPLDVLHGGDHGSTFGGNYLVTSAALEVLSILKEAYDAKRIDQLARAFDAHVEALLVKFPAIFTKHVGIGLIQGLRVNPDIPVANVIAKAHAHYLLVLKAGRNTLRFLPALTMTEDEMSQGFARLESALFDL